MCIFVPVDGSDQSMLALDVLKARHAHGGVKTEVHFFFALEPIPGRVAAFSNIEETKDYYDEQAKSVFQRIEESLKDTGIRYTLSYGVGNIPSVIAKEAERVNAKIIIMGTRGQGAVGGFLFGSVSNNVVAKTKVPVMILRGTPEPHTKPNLKIGIAFDGSKNSIAATKFAIEHRSFFGDAPEFELIHVCPTLSVDVMSALAGGIDINYAEEELEAYRDECVQNAVKPVIEIFKELGIQPNLVPLEGNAGHAIAEYADFANIDLIVMGSHGYGNFRAAMLGSVAMTIASASGKPLLIVR